MAHTFISLSHENPLVTAGREDRALLRKAINKAMGVLSGTERGTQFTIVSSSTKPATGCTAGISASGSGTVGITVAGVDLTATWASNDIGSAGLVAAAINASTDAKIQYLYGATNLKASITLANVLVGTLITVAGFKFTAIAGTTESYKDGEFTIGGTDTADGASFCAAVNRHPYASKYLFALNVAGVCHMYPKSAAWFTGKRAPQNSVKASASTVTITNATFIASAHYGVYAKVPGKWVNCVAVAASGTGQTVENSNGYFSRGLGGNGAPAVGSI